MAMLTLFAVMAFPIRSPLADDVAEVSFQGKKSVGPNTERTKGTLNPKLVVHDAGCAPALPGDR